MPGSVGGTGTLLTRLRLPIRIVNANVTILDTDFTVEVNASLGNIVITLPTAASEFDIPTSTGNVYNIKKIDATGNSVTIQPQGTDTIDGLPNVIITAQNVNYMVQTDGTKWVRL